MKFINIFNVALAYPWLDLNSVQGGIPVITRQGHALTGIVVTASTAPLAVDSGDPSVHRIHRLSNGKGNGRPMRRCRFLPP
jgi:hypothetical protein